MLIDLTLSQGGAPQTSNNAPPALIAREEAV